jgi:hypothetical protein
MPLIHETYLPRGSADSEERIYDGDHHIATIVTEVSEQAKYYAQLFAAAPRMVAAIQAACRETGYGDDDSIVVMPRDIFDGLSDALDAATEGTP